MQSLYVIPRFSIVTSTIYLNDKMRYAQPFTSKEYYLWRKDVEAVNPWERQYLNHQFLEYEQKRILKLSEWQNKIKNAAVNTILEEASLYTIPIELSSAWKAAITDYGDFKYVGLSALYNSPQILLIALLPISIKPPHDYRLIDVKRAKKINIFNKRLNMREPMIIIEEKTDWEYLKSDSIYKYMDISYERNVVQKIIEENLIHDERISVAFQTPILSAPPVRGSVGGISLASIAGDSSFAHELSKTIQRMVPPEYRESKPPKTAYSGHKFTYLEGIKFHLAERPYCDKNILSSFYGTTYRGVANKLSYRNSFDGEYSIFATISPNAGDETQAWKELMNNFTATEVTLPENIDYLPIEADVVLTKLIKAINEDLWLQVVHSRQKMPAISEELDISDTVNHVRETFDVLLTDVVRVSEDREFLVQSMLQPTQDNLKRISQSFARSDGEDAVSKNHLRQARNLVVANFEGFISHPEFQDIRFEMERSGNAARSSVVHTEDAPRYSILQTDLINNPRSSVTEIFESMRTTGRFRDIYDLQVFLDGLRRRGFVTVDSNNRYEWVGPPDSISWG